MPPEERLCTHVILFGRSTNQFVSHRVSVKKLLKSSGNELKIDFESAFRKVRNSYTASPSAEANLCQHIRDVQSRSSMRS